MITWENYEEYIMMYADGELQPAEETALMQFIKEHPELKSELAAYEATRFVPDETQVYMQKQSLLRTQPARTIAFPHWQRYGIAAGVAALIFISVFKWGMPYGNSNNAIAVKTTGIQLSPSTAQPAVNNAQPDSSLPKTATVTNQQSNITKPKQSNLKNSGKAYAIATTTKHNQKAINLEIIAQNTNELTKADIVALPVAEVKKILIDKHTDRNIPSLTELPLTDNVNEEVASDTQPQKRSFLDRLPLDDANKKQIKTITNVATGTAQQVSDIKENIFSQGLSIRINKKTIAITF